MDDTKYLTTPAGRKIAYVQTEGTTPGIVFLGGFRSDMAGTKALFLETGQSPQDARFCDWIIPATGCPRGNFLTARSANGPTMPTP